MKKSTPASSPDAYIASPSGWQQPWLGVHTDDVLEGRASDAQFRRSVVGLIVSRFAGSVAAQFLLVPAAGLIAAVARHL
jgi:hypothetical protein